ncbi:MAG: DUF11 domain-containing protein [Dokdonella sp.]|uniref:hypothetical protein n=1 Tax=Dokdonella sp. TaxID=2291710 RepID=UPI003BAFDAB0
MGTVGPAQFVTFVNGQLRSYTKAGVADGVLDVDPDVFFASVTTPVSPPVVFTFTSDPQIRYDRVTGRWILLIIDVPCTNATCSATLANRVMIAVSDAASNGTISASTVWTFFYFVGSAGSDFLDYPALGIDVNALYIGGNMFSSAGSFVGTNGYVVQKSSILGAGPIVTTAFANLAAGTGAGPYTPRGVDNFDVAATEGYFIGVDNATFSTLMLRRVSNPGSATPTISGNISITVPTTTFPDRVEHLGNTGGANGRLDALDDRLYEAMMRNGRLWTAHNFRVTAAGVASTAAQSRNASRWYELQNLTTTPTVVQSGTVYDNAATRAAARQYFIPSIAVTGQGHAVIGFTAAGVIGATPAYTGRLSGDALGSMNGSPGTGVTTFGTSTANYNPPSDPGGAGGRRWGDYSFTSVDPIDDMTVWTIQEYNQASNSYAVRVGKLLAPPPATPTCSGSPIAFNGPTGNVVIAATSSGGSGFYDPGSNLPPPALPFSHLSATVTNAVVNSVTYNSPTQVTLNITAAAVGLQNVTLTNPDGQNVTAVGCINVQSITINADLSVTKTDGATTATPGGSVTYTITAGNAGPSNATGATVADTFPASLTCTWTCVGAGGGTCTAAGSGNINDTVNLPSGGSTTYTASCAISAAATGSLSNTATVAAPGGVTDPTPGNNSATDTDTLAASADVAVTISDSRNFIQVGDSLDYLIEVSNPSGPSLAVASVSDILPVLLGGGSWTCTGSGGATCGSANGAGNALSDTATLPVGGKTSYLYSATVQAFDASEQIVNTASASVTNASDPVPGNNSATDTNVLVFFRDGFDPGSAGIVQLVGSGSDYVAARLGVDANLLDVLGMVPVDVATGQSADGRGLFSLQLARFGDDYFLRALTRNDLDQAERSRWQRLDLSERLLDFAWQSASAQANDGFIDIAGLDAGLLVSGSSEQGRLTQLFIRVDNNTPWLLLVVP